MLSDFLTEEVFKAGIQVGLLHWSQSGGPSVVLSVAQQDRLRQGHRSHSWTENPVERTASCQRGLAPGRNRKENFEAGCHQ